MSRNKWVVIALTLCIFTGCSDSDDDGTVADQTAPPAVAKTDVSFDRTKAAYVSTVTAALEEWTRKISALEERRNALSPDGQASVELQMSELVDRRDVLAKKIEVLEQSIEETYEAKWSAVDTELSGLNTAYDAVAKLLDG